MAHALSQNDPNPNSDDFFNHLLCNEVMEDASPPRAEEEATLSEGCLKHTMKRLKLHDCPSLPQESKQTETNAEASTSGQSSASKKCYSDSDATKTEIETNRSNTTFLNFPSHDCGIPEQFWVTNNTTPQDREGTRGQPLLPEEDLEYADENVDRNAPITVFYYLDQFYRQVSRRNGWTN